MKPKDLILRCYGYKRGDKWYGVCLDLNLATEEDSLNELKRTLNLMIFSYIETVCDTDDKASIPYLLRRRAPISDWVQYYYIIILCNIVKLGDRLTFNEIMPFTLAHGHGC